MSRITGVFDKLAREGRRALIPYVTAGDPFADITVDLMLGLARAGADVIELGIPFSDPMADGPVIQRASERALAAGIGMPQVLAMVREFRQRDNATPVVLMGYANPIERYGIDRFVDAAHGAGVDGVLVVDYPPEECEPFVARLKAAQLDPIFLLAPTSTDARMAAVGRMASGYVYYVSLKGVTGAGHLDTAAVAAMVPRIKSQNGRAPQNSRQTMSVFQRSSRTRSAASTGQRSPACGARHTGSVSSIRGLGPSRWRRCSHPWTIRTGSPAPPFAFAEPGMSCP